MNARGIGSIIILARSVGPRATKHCVSSPAVECTDDTDCGFTSVNIVLSSRVYISTLSPSACPQCVDGACTFGDDAFGACSTTNSALTTLDCPPPAGTFIATLPVDLSPPTTGDNLVTAPDGVFCPGQVRSACPETRRSSVRRAARS